jgi:3,4-dihydroxy 2-butanone 4-phosphate synthase / GTP cyclohydrolase II
VLCEIALDDGSMARRDYLRAFSRHHDLCMITIADLIRYRRARQLYDL